MKKKFEKIKWHVFRNFFKYVLLFIIASISSAYFFSTRYYGYLISYDSETLSDISVAFFGALGGSVTILVIESYRNKLRTLADINAAIAMFGHFINIFLNLKSQRTKSLSENYYKEYNAYNNMKSLEKRGFVSPQGAALVLTFKASKIFLHDIHFDVPLERIFSISNFKPQYVQVLMQAKTSALDVKRVCDEWDSLIESSQELEQEDKLPFFLGLRQKNGTKSTIFKDTIDNIVSRVDDGLWFSELTISHLQELANLNTPFWLRGRIGRNIVDPNLKSLMPPKDYKRSWLENLNKED